MLRSIIFAHREAMRILRKRYDLSLDLFNKIFVIFSLFSLNILLLIFNDDFYLTVFNPFSISNEINIRKSLVFFLFLLLFFMFEVNRRHLGKFINDYREEILLVRRLGLSNIVGLLPLIYIVFFLNFISSVISGGLFIFFIRLFYVFVDSSEMIVGYEIFYYLFSVVFFTVTMVSLYVVKEV